MTMIDIRTLVEQDRPKTGHVLFLSIDGHGGSGKSTLAKMLAAYFNSEVIHTDDFASMDCPRNWWPKIVRSVFRPIESGAVVLNYERSKWWENHIPEPVIDQRVSKIMILEEVGSSQLELRKYLGLSIYVDTPAAICLQRGIARDRAGNAGTDEEITWHWEQWMHEELVYFENDKPDKYADITVDGTIPFGQQILGINSLYE